MLLRAKANIKSLESCSYGPEVVFCKKGFFPCFEVMFYFIIRVSVIPYSSS